LESVGGRPRLRPFVGGEWGLAPGLAADEEFRRRFIAESRAAAADDPHIIPVYEAGEADGVLFIAMRFVPGGDLRGVLAREGRLEPAQTMEFISRWPRRWMAAPGGASAP
jgi:serine/threonine protein kinase